MPRPRGGGTALLAGVVSRRLLGAAFLGAALAAALALPGPGQAQEEVGITGSVVNGSEGGAPPVGIPVLLLVTDPDGGLIGTSQAATAQEGRFRFDRVPRTPGGSYSFSVDYAGVFYRTTFQLADLAEDVRLTVYEPTLDNSVITVTNQVMVITGANAKDRQLTAVEFVRLSNTSDRTLLPDLDNPQLLSFLRFALPPMAEDLDVGSDLPGGDIVSIGTGFALTSPVPPGDHFVDFSFRFPYQGDAVSYRQSLPQGSEVYQVMAPPQLEGLRVAPLERAPDVDLQGTLYRTWEGREFRPGQGLQLELTNLPQPSLGARLEKSVLDGSFWQVAIPCGLGAVLACLLLWGAVGRRRRRALGLAAAPSAAGSPGQREALVREIAALDERFQRGGLDEAEYRRQREGLADRALGSDAPEHPDPGARE